MIIRGRTLEDVDRRRARDAAIVELARRGLRPAEIGERYPGLSRGMISTIVGRARRQGERVPPAPSGPLPSARAEYARLVLPREALDILTGYANARGFTVERLAEELLEAAARDQLVNAILDDRP